MIAKISNGARVGGLAAYLHGPGRENEHTTPAGEQGGQVIGGNLLREGDTNGYFWAQDMREAQATRPDIERPVWHMSLRAAPQDPRLSDAQWRQIAQHMGESMGWESQPWVMVRHGDDHVHIVVSRVGYDGQVWSRRDDRYKARTACREVEREHGLTRTPQRSSEATQRRADHQITQGEYRRARESVQTPPRVELAERVRVARDLVAERGGGRTVFEQALRTAGVEVKANVSRSTGRVSGYSFHLTGHVDEAGQKVWFKASQLDRGLSWSKLAPALATKERVRVEVPPKRLLESRERYAERVHEVERAARDRSRADALGQVGPRVEQRSEANAKWWVKATVQGRATHRQQVTTREHVREVRKFLATSFPDKYAPVSDRKIGGYVNRKRVRPSKKKQAAPKLVRELTKADLELARNLRAVANPVRSMGRGLGL